MFPVKYANKSMKMRLSLDQYPNAGPNPNITGMRHIYGTYAYLVKSGSYLYNVPKDVYFNL